MKKTQTTVELSRQTGSTSHKPTSTYFSYRSIQITSILSIEQLYQSCLHSITKTKPKQRSLNSIVIH